MSIENGRTSEIMTYFSFLKEQLKNSKKNSISDNKLLYLINGTSVLYGKTHLKNVIF